MTEKLFNSFVRSAQSENLPIEGITVADEKKILFRHSFIPERPRNIYSHTKSYMSTAAGIAIDEGLLALDTRLADLFEEYIPENPDPRLLKITLKNLLTMSSGFGKPYLMGADRRSGMGFPDYLGFMMNRSVEEEPGTRFQYSTADSYLAGRMVEKASGRRLGEYLYEKVFRKLGQGWPQWENCPHGHPIGGGGMYMTLTDMQKIGQVCLAGGLWQGERIVSEAWVKEAGSFQISTGQNADIWNCGYGYQFWLSPYPGSFRADGAYGQVTTVLPESGLVVAFQCPEDGDFDRVKKAVHEQLLSQL